MSVPPPGGAPAAEPTAPSHPDAALTERPHPLSPLVKGWIAVAAVIFFLVQVPVMKLIMGLPMRAAAGTSSFMVGMTSHGST